jgi:hypothetical protein
MQVLASQLLKLGPDHKIPDSLLLPMVAVRDRPKQTDLVLIILL